MKMTTFLSLALLLMPALGFSETQISIEPLSLESKAPEKVIEFEPSKRKPSFKGTLKLVEQRKGVRLEFEAQGLARGKYLVVKGENCSDFAKKKFSHQKIAEADELDSFETLFGNISLEKNLKAHKLEDLQMDNKAVALVKVEKGEKKLVTCTE